VHGSSFGFHRCLPALAAAGNDLIVEHIIEFRACRHDLAVLLADLDVFLIGVHCALDEVDRRERVRGDRRIGEGRTHVELDVSTPSARTTSKWIPPPVSSPTSSTQTSPHDDAAPHP
jgi:chloramphenicol 3-O-phosphotransferase